MEISENCRIRNHYYSLEQQKEAVKKENERLHTHNDIGLAGRVR
jgi:hypothetical protein